MEVSKLNIAATQYSLSTKSFEIYVSGCKGNCKGCHNPELKDYGIGQPLTYKLIQNMLDKIKEFGNLVENIWVLGGEPLDQNLNELEELLKELSKANKPIWLFTRFDITEIPDSIKKYCDYIKCGPYIEELKTEDNVQYGVKLATSNQKIYKLKGGILDEQSNNE